MSISVVELKTISSQPMGNDSSVCTYINFCMNFDLLRSISQASQLLATYQAHPNFMYLDAAFLTFFTFQTGTLLVSRRKAEPPVSNMSVCLYYVSCALNSRSHLITNGVLLDPRVFEGINDSWIKLWKEQSSLSCTQIYSTLSNK